MNNTIAHVKYENHIKESLLSGKPIEHSMKDFLPNKQRKKVTKKNESSIRKTILNKMNENKKEYEGIENGMLRGWLLESYINKLMNEAETIEQVKEIYSTYKAITYNTPI